jgi:hypothetical protein
VEKISPTRVRDPPGERNREEMGMKSSPLFLHTMPLRLRSLGACAGRRTWARRRRRKAAFPLWAAVIIPFPSGRPPAVQPFAPRPMMALMTRDESRGCSMRVE